MQKKLSQFLFLFIASTHCHVPLSYASDIEINSPQTATQTFSEDNQAMLVGAGGDVSTFFTSAISEGSNTGNAITVNTGDATTGIAAAGNFGSAISINGSAKLSSLSLLSGRITSDTTGGGTLSLRGDGGVTLIYLSSGTSLTNTFAGGRADAILSNRASNASVYIENNGTIATNANSGSTAINLIDSDNNEESISSHIIANSGTITGEKAISIIGGHSDILNGASGTIQGDIVIGADDSVSEGMDSAITNNSGNGSITGNITSYRSAVILSNLSGTIIGNINIGNNARSSMGLAGGSVTGNISMGNSQQTLFITGGSINGTIDGGNLIILTPNYILNGDIGATTSAISITTAFDTSFDAATNNNSIRATNTFLSSGSSLSLGTGTLTTIIDGAEGKFGTLNLNGNNTFAAGTLLGSTNGLDAINILNGVSIVSGDSINATTTSIGTGGSSAASLNLAAGKSITGAVNINTNSSLTLNNNSAVNGNINGTSSSAGTLILSDGSTFSSDGNIGSTHSLSAITIGNGSTFNSSSNKTLNSASISLGNSAVLNLESNNSSTIGSINASSDNQGSVNSSGIASFNSIGATHSLSEFNILSGATTFNGDVSASQVSVSGMLDLATANAITGNLTINNAGSVNLNEGAHAISGDFTASSGSSISIGISNSTSAGSLIAAGVASISANTILRVTLGAHTTASGSSYTIVSGGAGSAINKISDANINIDGNGSNKSGSFIFTTEVLGNDLLLKVASSNASFATGPNQSNAYNAINRIDNASGELASVQNYLASGAGDSQKNTALKSVMPQTDNSVNRLAFNNSNSVSRIISERVNSVLNSGLSAADRGVSSGEELSDKNFWIQPLGSKAKQSTVAQVEGYTANSNGIALGVDKRTSKDFIVGAGLNYINSRIKSQNGLQHTQIDSYQLNFYNGYEYETYFANNIIGLTWNEYQGQRSIPVAGVAAKSKYSGQNYFARTEVGKQNKFENGLILTPTAMLTIARNTTADYIEDGAGTLNLSVKNKATNFLEGRAGLELSKLFSFNKNIFLPKISTSYGYDFIGSAQKSTSSFVGQSASFSSQGSKIAQGSFKIGAGMQFLQNGSTSFGLDYGYEHRNDYQSHYGALRFKRSF